MRFVGLKLLCRVPCCLAASRLTRSEKASIPVFRLLSLIILGVFGSLIESEGNFV